MSQISIRLSLLLTWLWCFPSCSSNKSSWLWSISRSCWSTRGRWRTTGWSRSWRSSRGSRSCSCWRTRRGDKRVSCRYRNKMGNWKVLQWWNGQKKHIESILTHVAIMTWFTISGNYNSCITVFVFMMKWHFWTFIEVTYCWTRAWSLGEVTLLHYSTSCSFFWFHLWWFWL